jgi:hypothetical protein
MDNQFFSAPHVRPHGRLRTFRVWARIVIVYGFIFSFVCTTLFLSPLEERTPFSYSDTLLELAVSTIRNLDMDF